MPAKITLYILLLIIRQPVASIEPVAKVSQAGNRRMPKKRVEFCIK